MEVWEGPWGVWGALGGLLGGSRAVFGPPKEPWRAPGGRKEAKMRFYCFSQAGVRGRGEYAKYGLEFAGGLKPL